MADEIHIRKTSSGYTATYIGCHAAEIEELFGAVTIPTAFTEKANPMEVLAQIRKLNSGVVVSLVGE